MNKLLNIYLLLLAGIFLPCLAFAQESNSAYDAVLDIGYYGDMLTHPGINFGLESNISRSASFELGIKLNIYGFFHQRNNTSISAEVHCYGRTFIRRKFSVGIGLGLGFLQPFYNSKGIYEVSDTGEISQTSRAGSLKLAWSSSLDLGYNLDQNQGLSMPYLRPRLNWQRPYNQATLMKYGLGIGYMRSLR